MQGEERPTGMFETPAKIVRQPLGDVNYQRDRDLPGWTERLRSLSVGKPMTAPQSAFKRSVGPAEVSLCRLSRSYQTYL